MYTSNIIIELAERAMNNNQNMEITLLNGIKLIAKVGETNKYFLVDKYYSNGNQAYANKRFYAKDLARNTLCVHVKNIKLF